MRFTIIGCGRMGSWFAERLAKRGADLLLLDQERRRAVDIAGRVGGRVLNSLNEIPPRAPVLLALPINSTVKVLGRLAKIKSQGLRIVEISSFKRPLMRQILYARRRGHVVASIHPLFGPGQRDDRGTVTIHVERASRGEDALIWSLLPRTRVLRMSWPEHDRAMLTALSLTHFIGVSAANLLSKVKPIKVETKSLSILLSLVSVSLNESSDFYAGYPMTSPEALRLFRRYGETVKELVEAFERGEAVKNVERVKRALETRYDLRNLYRRAYSNQPGS